jgi:hypothetical protein
MGSGAIVTEAPAPFQNVETDQIEFPELRTGCDDLSSVSGLVDGTPWGDTETSST